MEQWKQELAAKLKIQAEKDEQDTEAFNRRQRIIDSGAPGLWDAVKKVLASSVEEINDGGNYLQVIPGLTTSDEMSVLRNGKKHRSGKIYWTKSSHTLTVTTGRAPDPTFVVVADTAEGNAVFNRVGIGAPASAVAPEEIVRQFLQGLCSD